MDIGHSDAELNKFRKPEKKTLLIFCVNCILKITLIAVVLKKNGLCMKYYHSYLFFISVLNKVTKYRFICNAYIDIVLKISLTN